MGYHRQFIMGMAIIGCVSIFQMGCEHTVNSPIFEKFNEGTVLQPVSDPTGLPDDPIQISPISPSNNPLDDGSDTPVGPIGSDYVTPNDDPTDPTPSSDGPRAPDRDTPRSDPVIPDIPILSGVAPDDPIDPANSSNNNNDELGLYYAWKRPINTHSIRLHFSHLCQLKEKESCDRRFELYQFIQFAAYADAMHFSFDLLPSKGSLDQIHDLFPKIKILGKGVGFSVLYESQMIHPDQPMNITALDDEINTSYRSIRTSVHPREWAMDIIPNESQDRSGLLVTKDPLLSYPGGGSVKNEFLAAIIQDAEYIAHLNCLPKNNSYSECMASAIEKTSGDIQQKCNDSVCINDKNAMIARCRANNYQNCNPLFPRSPLNYKFEVKPLTTVIRDEFRDVQDNNPALPGQYLISTHCRRRQFETKKIDEIIPNDQLNSYLFNMNVRIYEDFHFSATKTAGLSQGLSLFPLRAYIMKGNRKIPFYQSAWFNRKSNVSIEDGACFAFDPGKERTSEVFANSISAFTDEYHADGVIMDDLPTRYRGIGDIEFDTDSSDGFSNEFNLDTIAVPWKFPGEGHFRYLIGLANGHSTPHQRSYDNASNPKREFSRTFLDFVKNTRDRLGDNQLWCINMNTVSAQFEEGHYQFTQWQRLAQGVTVPCTWDEKWGNDLAGSNIEFTKSLRRLYLRLYTVHHASKLGQMAILWSMYFNYNDGDSRPYLNSFFSGSGGQGNVENYIDRYGSKYTYNLEDGLVRYLLALDKPSIQLQPFRYNKTNVDSTIRMDNLFSLMNTPTWLAHILNMNAGQPTMTTAGIAGVNSQSHQVLYRQYENALALLNITEDEAVRVTLPDRSCENCNNKYYYIRMTPWKGIDRRSTEKVPLHYLISQNINGRPLVDIDTYRAGDRIVIPPQHSILLFNEEAIDWSDAAARRVIRRYLTSYKRCEKIRGVSDCRVETVPPINHENASIRLQIENGAYRDFLEDLPARLDD